ncbi:hypothetical protein [Wolbachia endosymbiont (group A) of Andrena haemorrhoa]|nr:hypothetical protein [Wolbachia endosymbiont (group A) of Andrena haemorrhoa]
MVREYTAEFKLEAVKLANEQRKAGQTITKIARDLEPVLKGNKEKSMMR